MSLTKVDLQAIGGIIRSEVTDIVETKVSEIVESKVTDIVETKVSDIVQSKVTNIVETKVSDIVQSKVTDIVESKVQASEKRIIQKMDKRFAQQYRQLSKIISDSIKITTKNQEEEFNKTYDILEEHEDRIKRLERTTHT